MKINKKSLLYGTLVLTLANFIVRILGFVYRVALSRIAGPEGMGLIQLAYPVFFISVGLVTSGIPVAVSRLIAEKKAKGDISGVRRTTVTALMLAGSIAAVITVVMLFGLDYISENILKDARTKGALFVLYPSIVMIAFGVVIKGYFYGLKDIHPPAAAEIIEQLVRMGTAVALVSYFNPTGNLAVTAALVTAGTVLGEMASLLYLHTRYRIASKNLCKTISRPASTEPVKAVLQSIASIAIPVTLTRLATSLINSANTVMIPQRLMASGLSRADAMSVFGIMSGMVMPLLFFPFAITNALSVIIIPNLSENLTLKNWKQVNDKVSKAILITCVTAFPSIALLYSLGRPVGDMLYRQPVAGELLIPLSFGLVLHALQHTSSSILNGLGKQNRAAAHFIASSIIQFLCTYFLIANPSIRIYGLVIGFYLSGITVCALNMAVVLKTAKMRFRPVQWLVKPGVSAFLMAFVIVRVYRLTGNMGTSPVLNMFISFLPGLITFMLSMSVLYNYPLLHFPFLKKKTEI